jgi:hypothetical protein
MKSLKQSQAQWRDVTERAKLWMYYLISSLMAMVPSAGCGWADSNAAHAPRPAYELVSRRLVRLDWDANGDGRIEQRTYVTGTMPLRTEIDRDGDGRVDVWEYVGSSGAVSRVGSASANDGVEDTWTWMPDGRGEVRVDRAQYRDGVTDRREYFRSEVLVRAEEDANRDGRFDKWETWDSGVLRVAAFDISFEAGRPNRRLVYGGDGRFEYMEADLNGDGRFWRVAATEAVTAGEVSRD